MYHYLQGYPCQLGGRNRKYKINVRLLNTGNQPKNPKSVLLPTKTKNQQKGLPSSKIPILQLLPFTKIRPSVFLAQDIYSAGIFLSLFLKISTCCHHRLESSILCMIQSSANMKSVHRSKRHWDCGVSVCTINLQGLGSWTQLARAGVLASLPTGKV